MVALIGYLKITRPLNLVIVALLQIVMYYKILIPVFNSYNVDSVFASYLFPLFVLVTLIITASGNVINDIVDVDIDKINKPEKWIVGNLITVGNARIFYFSLLIVGGVVAYIIAYKLDRYYLLSLYVFSVGFLYLYSMYLKRVLIIGNLVVSFFAAGVIGIILIFEYDSGNLLKNIDILPYNYIRDVFFGFMIFSFLTTMYREIVKDIQDVQGDKLQNASTIPLVFGIYVSKIIAAICAIALLVSLIYWTTIGLNEDRIYLKLYDWVIVIPYLLLTFYLLIKANRKYEFSKLSKMIKIFMLLGMLMLVFYFL